MKRPPKDHFIELTVSRTDLLIEIAISPTDLRILTPNAGKEIGQNEEMKMKEHKSNTCGLL